MFAAKLENGHKIFLETEAVGHIVSRHLSQFEKTFGIKSKAELISTLSETISKGKLVKSSLKYVNGKACYSNKYYYKGKYSILYGIADNGYIETAYPKPHIGGK